MRVGGRQRYFKLSEARILKRLTRIGIRFRLDEQAVAMEELCDSWHFKLTASTQQSRRTCPDP